MTDATTTRIDGRSRRGERTRADIVAACRALMRAGNFRPSVVAIAEATPCSTRSVFRYFAEPEAVHLAALDERTRDAVAERIVPANADLLSAFDVERITYAAVFGRPQPATAE